MQATLRRLFSTTSAVAFMLAAASAFAQPPGNAAAVQRALDAIRNNPAEVRAGAGQVFLARSVVADPDGATHVRFERTYNGLRVLGGDFVIHLDALGGFRSASLTLPNAPGLALRPTLTARDAADIAARAFGAGGLVNTPELVIEASNAPALAYEAIVTGLLADGTPSERHYVVQAHSGSILDSWDAVQTAKPRNDVGFFNGAVELKTTPAGTIYQLIDPSRGNQSATDMNNGTSGLGVLFTDADDAWGDGSLTTRQTIAVDAQYGAAQTWDYYLNVHSRAGIRDDGVGALSRVHYSVNYNNAFWNDTCFCMTYGDGDGVNLYPLASLDVAGHEMSHGVTSATANLRYSGESGGLNEATSDIFGTAVEFYTNNALDTPDYDIGEELFINGGAIRYMYRPSKDGASADCYSRRIAGLNVHYSSGVANHFFYLLSEGSGVDSRYTDAIGATTCNGSVLNGIGIDKAERIWYRALTIYMTSRTNYAGARVATLSAAADLFGAGSAEHNGVVAAWAAVSVQ
jgi:zinc metalloprotease ZmpA